MRLFKVAYPLLFVLALLSLTLASADNQPKPSAKPTPTPKPPPVSSCKGEVLCCLSLEAPIERSVSLLLGLLGIKLTSEQEGEQCGLTCTTLSKRGLGDECFEKSVCCDKSYDAGIIAIGCKEVSV
ncbi:hypothetical protein DFH11DRAFT_809188 [Phellopilus nigrolimitatus]|nr:hypothetical protein DFH11DRAFT_809188 [Phellopilus nigrolimitatus]